MEENLNNQQPVGGEPEQEDSQNWKSVMIGGIPGILLGAGGVLVAQAFTADPQEPAHPITNPDDQTNPLSVDNGIPVAHSVTNDMSFSEAFATAREEVGPGGAFSWHGNVYSTYRSDDPEWVEMGPEGQQAHCHDIIVQVHVEPYSQEPDVVVILDDTTTEMTDVIVDPDIEDALVYGPPIPDEFENNDIDIEADVYGPPVDDIDSSSEDIF